MYARTVVPRVTLASKAELAELKDRSLGSVLFKDPTMQRGAFEIARIYPDDDWHAYIQSLVNVGNETFWARRSIFHVQQHPLLLTEVFLPDILTLTR
jgi:chorismate--pyruvate lyase